MICHLFGTTYVIKATCCVTVYNEKMINRNLRTENRSAEVNKPKNIACQSSSYETKAHILSNLKIIYTSLIFKVLK